jgi:class 3 adenylate cyclase
MEELRRSFPSREGREEASRESAPSLLDNPAELEWWVRYQLLSVAPGANVAEGKRYIRTDIRPILPSIHVPVLVFYRPEVWAGFRDSSRYLAEHIPGAARRELPGEDSLLWLGDQHAVHQSIDAFLDEVRSEEAMFERTLATVLFTDIVGSTQKAGDLGDRAWRELVERHHALVRAMLARYRGTEIDTAGDGFFASFDGPARAVRCAQAIVHAVRDLGIEIRAGLHTGEVETINRKVGGIAVTIGARAAAQAQPGEVLVSSTVKDLVAGSGLTFEDAGEQELRGVPDRWRLYRVVSGS